MQNQAEDAIVTDEPLTFSSLWSKTDAFAGGLKDQGLTTGDHVAIRLSDPRAFLVAFYGTLRNGCVPVTIPTQFSADDVVVALNETDGAVYVTDETPFLSILHRAEAVKLAVTVDCEGGMGMDFETFLDNDGINTAGSRSGIDVVSQADTDRGLVAYGRHAGRDPLGIVYDQSALLAAARTGQEIAASDGPIHHLGSLSLSNPIELLYGATAALLSGGQYAAIFTGGRHYPQTGWDPETVRSLLHTGPGTRTFLTPDQYDTIELSGGDGGEAVVVADPVSDPIVEPTDGTVRTVGCPETGLTHRNTGFEFASGHGRDTVSAADRTPLGTPIPTVDTRVTSSDHGEELVVRGPATMTEYVAEPALTDDVTVSIDGKRWIRTGISPGNGEVTPIEKSPLAALGPSHS